MGKSTISMVIFHSYVKLPEGTLYHPFLITLGLQLSMNSANLRMEFPEIQLKSLDWLSREKLNTGNPRVFTFSFISTVVSGFIFFPQSNELRILILGWIQQKKRQTWESSMTRWESYPFNLDRNYIIIHSQDRISRKKSHEIASWLSGGTPSPWPHQEQAMISVDRNVRPKMRLWCREHIREHEVYPWYLWWFVAFPRFFLLTLAI